MTTSLLLFLYAGCYALPAAAFKIPDDIPSELQKPVLDYAGILTDEAEAELNRILLGLYDAGGSQIAVITLPDLAGLTIEEAGVKIADKLRLGDAATDRGVILLVSLAERKARIDVGYGNEGNLPDVVAKRIVDDVIAPRFKQRNYDEGVMRGVAAIMAATDPDWMASLQGRAPPRRRNAGSAEGFGRLFVSLIALLLFSVPFLLPLVLVNIFGVKVRGRMKGMRGYHSPDGGFGSGGGFGIGRGGGGSGGFGGGGGGFGGGGASGEW